MIPACSSQPASQPVRCESVACVYSHNPFSSFLCFPCVCLFSLSLSFLPPCYRSTHSPNAPPPLICSQALVLSRARAHAHTHTRACGHMLCITGSDLQTGFSSSCLLDLSSKTSLFFLERSGPSPFLFFLPFLSSYFFLQHLLAESASSEENHLSFSRDARRHI